MTMDDVENCCSYKFFYVFLDILHRGIIFHLSGPFHLLSITPSDLFCLRIRFEAMNIVDI
jgi:hypothetical protein